MQIKSWKILKIFTLIFTVLYSHVLLSVELGSFSEVFSKAPNTINAYQTLCMPDAQGFTQPLDDTHWKNMCEVVKGSELCENIPPEEQITCQDRDEDQIDVASLGFFWNCVRALGSVFMDMLKFIKEAIFTAVGYAFDSETRSSVNQKVADIHDALSLYIANEYAHLQEENPDSSRPALWAKLSGSIMGDALSFLSSMMKESFVELGCYNQDAREKKACEYVLSVAVPPASFFALFKLGPKAYQFGRRAFVNKRTSSVVEELNDSVDSVEDILELQRGVKPTQPRKKVAVKNLDEEFWQQDTPVMVSKGDQSFPVTYSFDSEIPHSAVFNLIYSDAESTAKLTALLRNLKVRESSGRFGRTQLVPYQITRDELKRILEKSDKQLDTFIFRRGVDLDKEVFDLTDLNSRYVDDFMVPILKQYNKDKTITDLVDKDFDPKSIDEFFLGYQKLADDLFSGENIPANATRDQMWIEMVHKGSESNPLEYRNLMLERYRPLTNSASSHLHVGVPAIVPQDRMMAIGRAVETRIILENAHKTAKPGELYATSYSTLHAGASDAKRSAGLVRMNYERFKEPHVAHDLEIRQYSNMEEGMNNIAMASNMAAQYERIKVIDMPKLSKISDPSTSNLTGALTYTARMFAHSADQELKRKAAKLEALVDEIQSHGSITPEHRIKVQELLKEEKILDSFNEDILLEVQ